MSVTPNFLKNLIKYKVSFMGYEKPNNSAFIINVMTVLYLFIFQIINPPNRCIVYFCESFRSLILLAKEAFVMISNSFPPPNLSLNVQIFHK